MLMIGIRNLSGETRRQYERHSYFHGACWVDVRWNFNVGGDEMSERFTKGEWIIGDENNQCCEVQIGETVCSISRYEKMSGVMVIDRDEMLANAHLIAAAPEMYHALDRISRRMQAGTLDEWSWQALVDLAERTLKEARGES